MSKNRFYFFKDYVTSGKSKLFNSLHDLLDIELDDFLRELEWVFNDPFNEYNMVTRDIAFQLDGSIVRVRRAFSKDLNYVAFYNLDGTLFNNSLTAYMLNSRDHKMTFDTEVILNYPKNVELYVDNYKDYTPREILLKLYSPNSAGNN